MEVANHVHCKVAERTTRRWRAGKHAHRGGGNTPHVGGGQEITRTMKRRNAPRGGGGQEITRTLEWRNARHGCVGQERNPL